MLCNTIFLIGIITCTDFPAEIKLLEKKTRSRGRGNGMMQSRSPPHIYSNIQPSRLNGHCLGAHYPVLFSRAASPFLIWGNLDGHSSGKLVLPGSDTGVTGKIDHGVSGQWATNFAEMRSLKSPICQKHRACQTKRCFFFSAILKKELKKFTGSYKPVRNNKTTSS